MDRNKDLLKILNINSTNPVQQSTVSSTDEYDHKGALWYVVMVISVYAMAIFFMIVSHVRRRADKREIDREINSYLRSAHVIKEAEEKQRRENLQKAMKPFIELALNKRSLGVQTESTLNGGLSTSNSFIATFGVPNHPSYTQHLQSTDNEIKPGKGSNRRRHRPKHHDFTELKDVFTLDKNDKVVQAEMDEYQTLRVVCMDTPSPSTCTSLRSSANNILSSQPSVRPLSIIRQGSTESSSTDGAALHLHSPIDHKEAFLYHSSSESSLSDRLLEGGFLANATPPLVSSATQSAKSSHFQLDDLDNWNLEKSGSSRRSCGLNRSNDTAAKTGHVPLVCSSISYTPKYTINHQEFPFPKIVTDKK